MLRSAPIRDAHGRLCGVVTETPRGFVARDLTGEVVRPAPAAPIERSTAATFPSMPRAIEALRNLHRDDAVALGASRR